MAERIEKKEFIRRLAERMQTDETGGHAVAGWRAGGDVSDLQFRPRANAARLRRLLPGLQTRQLGLQVQPRSEAACPLRLVLQIALNRT